MSRGLPIGQRIAHWRRLANLSQTKLARRLGLNPSSVCKWESGKAEPSEAFKEAMAEIFGISMGQFYGDLGEEEPERQAG